MEKGKWKISRRTMSFLSLKPAGFGKKEKLKMEKEKWKIFKRTMSFLSLKPAGFGKKE